MKKFHTLIILSSVFCLLLSAQGVNAQSIGGDSACGGSAETSCTLADAGKIINRALSGFVIPIGSIALVLFIMIRFVLAYKAYVEGNASAFKDATKQVGNAIFGFIILIALFGGLLFVLLKFVGIRSDSEFNPLRLLQLISSAVVSHSYAIEGRLLPNPTTVTNLYDFLLMIARLVIRWFVYPAVIVMWVWSGFSYISAQGNPEMLAKAHKWLMWTVVCTLIIFAVEGFLFAIRGSVQQILSGAKTAQQVVINPSIRG